MQLTQPQFDHITVMREAAVQALVHDEDGYYVDGTFGRGGHASRILEQLSPRGRLMAIDQDADAVAVAHEKFADDARFSIQQGSFTQMNAILAQREWMGKVAGVLLDLGVSSPQLDNPERGFSFQKDGPLDMRMNQSGGESAAEWIASATVEQIAQVLFTYGEEKFGRRMAQAIVREREKQPIATTARLASIIAAANPRWEKGKHPATRAFQAIRIYINGELEALESVLEQSLEALATNGVLVVISFHSLEDRLVKRFIRHHVKGDAHLPAGLPVQVGMLKQRLQSKNKPIKASEEEVKHNPRARSAVMRVAVKCA